MHFEKKFIKRILVSLLTSLLLITGLPLLEVGGAVEYEDEGARVDVDPLVTAGYRPRYPYEGSPFIQTPSPAPEGVKMVSQSGDEIQELSASPTRRTYELYYSYSILEAYVDTDPGDLSSSEWDLLKRFCDDFVNISYGRSKDYFDPLDKVDDVVFYVYNIDGPSGIGGYYQPGTHHFFVDRADLNWAGVIIAHEFQHYIHRQYDPYEYLWIDEGFADLSAYLTYGLDSVVGQHALYYLKYYPTVSLVISDSTFQSNIVYYGSSFMYGLYMMEHYGGRNYTRTLVKSGQRGTSGVNSALTILGYSDRFDTSFHKWKVATRINDDHAGEDKEFAYKEKTFGGGYTLVTNLQGSWNGIPQTRSGNLNSYGVVSLRFSSPPDPNEDYRLKISIPSGTPDVALYEESSPPRSVHRLSFSGNSVTYDLTKWGSQFDTFQLMLSSSQVSEYSISLDILDIDPPVTEAFVQPGLPDGEDGWYVNSPKITLTTEPGASKFYQFNSGDTVEYAGPIYIPEGIYNVSYWSEDTRDNVENKRHLNFKVDLSTPRSSIDIDPKQEEGEWYISPPAVYLYTTHLYSEIYYTWGNRDFNVYTDQLTAPEGTNSLIWYAIDQAGNREMMREREFMVDTSAPEIEVNIYPLEPDGENGWYVSRPRITLSTEDNAEVYYSLDGSPMLLYDIPLDILPGDHEVRITAHDQAGNKAPEMRYQFRVDTGFPTLFGQFDKFQYSVENSSKWLSILPTLALWSDDEKADITYTVNGGEPVDYKGDITIGQGESEINVYGKDRAGNPAEPLSFNVRIDSLKPKVEHRIDDMPIDGWYRSSEVELSLIDVSSGSEGSPVSISYRWDHEEWTLYRSPISVREGIHVLQYSAMDSAGNAMDPRAADLKKDSVLPTGHISVMGLLDNNTVEILVDITFDMTSSLDTSGIGFYRLDFGDGEITSWSGYAEFTHNYGEVGTYTVTGWVKDHAGNEQSKAVEVIVWKASGNVTEEEQGSGISLPVLLGGLFILVLLVVFLIQMAVIMKRRNQQQIPHVSDGRDKLPHRSTGHLPPAHTAGPENGDQEQIGHVNQGEVIPLPEHLRD